MSNNAQRHRQRRPSRKEKQSQGVAPIHKDKFQEQRQNGIDKFVLTQSQKVFVNKIRQNAVNNILPTIISYTN